MCVIRNPESITQKPRSTFHPSDSGTALIKYWKIESHERDVNPGKWKVQCNL